MRTSRRPAAATRLALGLAALATVASGCSYASPAVITTPYAASDGTNAELGAVKFRNFLVASEAEGRAGVVVGSVVADGGQPVQVRLTVLDAPGGTSLAQAVVPVTPGQLAPIGTGEGATRLQLQTVPVQPGAVLTLHAQTPAGGLEFAIPVVPLTNEYRTLTPVPTPTPTSSGRPEAGGSPSPSGSATPSGAPATSSSTSG